MKVLVCGGRNYANRGKVFTILDTLDLEVDIKVIVTGGARGADRLAEQWASQRLVECRVYRPNWKDFGRAAGPLRNKQMLVAEEPDLVVAFPGGAGTDNMVALAVGADVKVLDVREDTE